MAQSSSPRFLRQLADWALAAVLIAIAGGAGLGVLTALSASMSVWPPLWDLVPGLLILAAVAFAQRLVMIPSGSSRVRGRWWRIVPAAFAGLVLVFASQWYLWTTESLALSGSTGVFGETIQSGPNGIAGTAVSALALPILAGVVVATLMAVARAVMSRRTSAST